MNEKATQPKLKKETRKNMIKSKLKKLDLKLANLAKTKAELKIKLAVTELARNGLKSLSPHRQQKFFEEYLFT